MDTRTRVIDRPAAEGGFAERMVAPFRLPSLVSAAPSALPRADSGRRRHAAGAAVDGAGGDPS